MVLSDPCSNAQTTQTLCELGLIEGSTAPSFCFLDGCDVKLSAVREGPGRSH